MARVVASGLVTIAAFAAQMAESLLQRGVSSGGVRARLAQKGVASAHVTAALAALGPRGARDVAAACALVRRRRLGPLRTPAGREAYRERDLGTLARAGFSLDIARRVLACADADALDELARAPEE